MSVTDWEFEIDDGVSTVRFGGDTAYHVYDFTHGKPAARISKNPMPRADGTQRGRDYLDGTLAAFDMAVIGDGPAETFDLLGTLRRSWYADAVRHVTGARSILRMKRPGREAVRMYGRPDVFDPATLTNAASGHIPLIADFDCDDGYFYSDVEFTAMFGIIPEALGGLIGPLIGPLQSEPASEGTQSITVGGTEPAYLVAKVQGPITDPVVEVTGQWAAQLRLTLASDQFVTIDPTPWNRSVRRNDGANMAGRFTQASPRLSAMRVPPGVREVILRGIDPTGTSSLTTYHRSVYASY